jgi:hypothetical protein
VDGRFDEDVVLENGESSRVKANSIVNRSPLTPLLPELANQMCVNVQSEDIRLTSSPNQ